MDNSNVKLSKREIVLIAIGIANTAAIAFGGYFIAKWTVSLTGSVTSLLWQFCMQIVPSFVAFFLTLKIMHLFKTSSMYALSFFIQILAYITFFTLAKNSYVSLANVLFGLVSGLGNGVFWSCNNNFSVSFTSSQTRVKYISFSGIGNMSMNMLSNILIIVLMVIFGSKIEIPDVVYTTFFATTILFYLIAMLFSIKLNTARYPLKLNASMIKSYKEPKWKKFLGLCVLYGINNSIPDAILGVTLIAFTCFSNYFYLWMVVLSIGIKTFANYVFKTKAVAKRRFSVYLICASLAIINLLALALTYTSGIGGYIALIVLLVNSFVLILRTQTETIVHYETISKFATSEVELSGRFLSREVAITLGKSICAVIMLATGLFFKENISIVLIVILGYLLSSVIMMFVINKEFRATLES